MKKFTLMALVAGLVCLGSCASNSSKLFTESINTYDSVGVNITEYRMGIAASKEQNETSTVSICFLDRERVNLPSVFVLRFERTITYSEIDAKIAMHNAWGRKTTRNDHLLTGKVRIADYGLSTRLTLEADNQGVQRIPASSYIKEFFLVNVDKELLQNIFSADAKNIMFLVNGSYMLVGIPSEKYEEAKNKIFQFYEKHKAKIH